MDRVRTRTAQIFALLFWCLGVAWAQDTTVRRVNNLAPFAERLDADGAAFSWTMRNGAPTLSSAFGEHGRVEVIGLDCVRPNDARAPCAAFQFRFQRETAHEDHAQLVHSGTRPNCGPTPIGTQDRRLRSLKQESA